MSEGGKEVMRLQCSMGCREKALQTDLEPHLSPSHSMRDAFT